MVRSCRPAVVKAKSLDFSRVKAGGRLVAWRPFSGTAAPHVYLKPQYAVADIDNS